MKGLLSGLIALLLTFGGGYWTGKHFEAKAQQEEVDRLNTQARAKEEALAHARTLINSTNTRQLYVAKLTRCLAYVETEDDSYTHEAEFL